MYLMQTWFNLSDEGTEDAIYDSYAMRSFLGINFMTEQVPDATTLLKFRNRRMSLKDEHLSQIDYRICKRPSGLKTSKDYEGINWEKQMENRISSIRCKVEHAFLIVKRDFGYRKVAYRGIAKNMNRFHVLFGCANLLMCIRAGRTEQFRNKQVAPIAG